MITYINGVKTWVNPNFNPNARCSKSELNKELRKAAEGRIMDEERKKNKSDHFCPCGFYPIAYWMKVCRCCYAKGER